MSVRAEAGFTLVELLVATVITTVVIAAIAASIVVGLRTTDATNERLAESHDAQIAAAYFVPDVHSADDASTSDTECAGATPVIRLRWTDGSVVKVASYVSESAGGELRLTRKYCEDGAPVSTLTIAHRLSASVPPTVACTGLAGSSCTGEPATATLQVTDTSGYSFEITAARRVS